MSEFYHLNSPEVQPWKSFSFVMQFTVKFFYLLSESTRD